MPAVVKLYVLPPEVADPKSMVTSSPTAPKTVMLFADTEPAPPVTVSVIVESTESVPSDSVYGMVYTPSCAVSGTVNEIVSVPASTLYVVESVLSTAKPVAPVPTSVESGVAVVPGDT